MTNDEIKVCFNQEPDWRTKCEVIKHFILSKTTQSIEYIEPCGDISHRLTFMFNRNFIACVFYISLINNATIVDYKMSTLVQYPKLFRSKCGS